ncbi:MAG: hypothetical protein ABI123_08770 [Ginsengibacter sp.]
MKTKMVFAKKMYALLAIALLFSLSSYAQKMVFHNTGVAPAAEAKVRIKHTRNKNYSINLKVVHLAPAPNLNPPKKTYVAWMITENNGTKNIGQFRSKSGLISKALKGAIKTVTPFKPTGFFITAEDNGAITDPGDQVILKTN